MKCKHSWAFLEKCEIKVPLTKKELEEQENRLEKRKIDLEKYKSMYEAYKMQEEYCRELGLDEYELEVNKLYSWRNGRAQKAALDTLKSLWTALQKIGGDLEKYSLCKYIYKPDEFEEDMPLQTHKTVPARRYHCQKCLAITEKKV